MVCEDDTRHRRSCLLFGNPLAAAVGEKPHSLAWLDLPYRNSKRGGGGFEYSLRPASKNLSPIRTVSNLPKSIILNLSPLQVINVVSQIFA